MSILLFDLEGDEAATLSSVLQKAGFSVHVRSETPTSGEWAGCDAVIVGARSPEGHAARTCKRLRMAGYLGAIVVVSPPHGSAEGVACLEHGADDFVPRPFDANELTARVRAVLRRGAGHARVDRGPLTLDRSERVAYLRGRALALTAREYALLARLADSGGDVLTRADLLAAVWHRDDEPASNLVDVTLSRLRDKLGSDASMIETVRRGGYRLRG